jgi:hypothetical protein
MGTSNESDAFKRDAVRQIRVPGYLGTLFGRSRSVWG